THVLDPQCVGHRQALHLAIEHLDVFAVTAVERARRAAVVALVIFGVRVAVSARERAEQTQSPELTHHCSFANTRSPFMSSTKAMPSLLSGMLITELKKPTWPKPCPSSTS